MKKKNVFINDYKLNTVIFLWYNLCFYKLPHHNSQETSGSTKCLDYKKEKGKKTGTFAPDLFPGFQFLCSSFRHAMLLKLLLALWLLLEMPTGLKSHYMANFMGLKCRFRQYLICLPLEELLEAQLRTWDSQNIMRL